VDSVRLGVLHVLVFLEISSRRVIFCNATANPDSAWVAQQARNVAWELEELKIPITVLIRDRDSKYSSDFNEVFSAAGIRIARTPFRSPRAKYLERYNGLRPHRSLELRPPRAPTVDPAVVSGPVVRRT
jgi:hypothetical protein